DPFTVSPDLSVRDLRWTPQAIVFVGNVLERHSYCSFPVHGSAEPLPSTVKESTMPTPAYMTIEGTNHSLDTDGTITEDSSRYSFQEGHEDQIRVQDMDHHVIIPRDPQSGQPTGQRVHEPLMITKVFDKSSPLLFNALTSG